MKRIFVGILLLLSAFSMANADTYSFDVSNDIVHTNTPVETIYGYDAYYTVVVPNPLPASSAYTVSITGKSLTTQSIQNVNGITVTATDGLGGSLSSPNTNPGDVSGSFTAPSSGSVTLTENGRLTGATCNWMGDGSCVVPPFSSSLNVPVSSASVNLNIVRLENLLNSFFSLFTVDIASAGGQ